MKKETIQEKKAQLRRKIRETLREMPLEERRASDQDMFERFLFLPFVEEAKTVFLFYGVGEEPETSRLIPLLQEAGKRIALPICLPDYQMEAREVTAVRSLIPSKIAGKVAGDILEPSKEDSKLLRKEELDLILVPALCCDRQGFRLGQGGGYYDRFLEDYTGITASLCRQKVLQESLPHEKHDQKIAVVITEEELLVFKRA